MQLLFDFHLFVPALVCAIELLFLSFKIPFLMKINKHNRGIDVVRNN